MITACLVVIGVIKGGVEGAASAVEEAFRNCRRVVGGRCGCMGQPTYEYDRVVLQSLYIWLGWIIGRRWRRALVARLHSAYFSNNLFYHILTTEKQARATCPSLSSSSPHLQSDFSLLLLSFGFVKPIHGGSLVIAVKSSDTSPRRPRSCLHTSAMRRAQAVFISAPAIKRRREGWGGGEDQGCCTSPCGTPASVSLTLQCKSLWAAISMEQDVAGSSLTKGERQGSISQPDSPFVCCVSISYCPESMSLLLFLFRLGLVSFSPHVSPILSPLIVPALVLLTVPYLSPALL